MDDIAIKDEPTSFDNEVQTQSESLNGRHESKRKRSVH